MKHRETRNSTILFAIAFIIAALAVSDYVINLDRACIEAGGRLVDNAENGTYTCDTEHHHG